MSFPIITVDGPSGAGKGTLCSRLAQTLNYQLLDSGALYRIVGLKAAQAGLLDEESIAALITVLNIEFVTNITETKANNNHDSNHYQESGNYQESDKTQIVVNVMVDGKNVGNEIRNEKVGAYASRVAALPKVRAALLTLQTNMADKGGLVADGRDMGTVVFPDADAKIFLTASAEARAKRRVNQLQQAGQTADYPQILADIKARDERDENRVTSPSKPAIDAIVIDSSELDAETVFIRVKRFCQTKGISFSV